MIKKLKKLLTEQKELETRLENIRVEIKNQCGKLTPKEIESCDYETLKNLYSAIYFRLDEEQNQMISDILTTKKAAIYPQMLKPTYFPEIDQLCLPDSEKVRLDKAARNNIRYYISNENIECLEHPMTIKDLEILTTIDVAEKLFNFRCPDCNSICKTVTQKELDSHKRVWELVLLRKKQGLTEEQEQELETLEEDGAGYIYLTCMDDEEFEDEITDMEQFQKYKNNMDISYRIIKSPDLTYEKL